MIQQGTLPLAQQDKAIAAIQAGGKSVDELTGEDQPEYFNDAIFYLKKKKKTSSQINLDFLIVDFCKSLSKSEALGELSSISSDDDGSTSDKGFHHPFLVKDRPNSIIMNIRVGFRTI